jgi:hypothetical protein
MAKKFIRNISILNAVLIVWALAFFLFTDKVAMIIAWGLKPANRFIVFNIVLLIGFFVAGNAILLIRNRKLFKRSKQPQPLPPLMTVGEGKHDPGNIRKDLQTLMTVNPEWSALLSEGIAQLDSIDKKQAQLKDVLARNDSGALNEVENAIDEAEVCLSKNLSKVVDRAIMLNSLERVSPEKDAILQENENRMTAILKKNAEVLSLCDILLTESINYLDEKDASVNSGALNLEAMTDAIRTLRTLNGSEI